MEHASLLPSPRNTSLHHMKHLRAKVGGWLPRSRLGILDDPSPDPRSGTNRSLSAFVHCQAEAA